MQKVENRSAEDKKSASEIKTVKLEQSNSTSNVSNEWADDEIKLLVKGVKVIAVGVRDRWDVIANFIEEHSKGKYKRTGKEVLTKTKEMQKMGKYNWSIFLNKYLIHFYSNKIDPSVKEEANKKAYEKTVQNIKEKTEPIVQDKPSERYTSK